jgi:hypothetical protein
VGESYLFDIAMMTFWANRAYGITSSEDRKVAGTSAQPLSGTQHIAGHSHRTTQQKPYAAFS